MYKCTFYRLLRNREYELAKGWGEVLEAPDGTLIEIALSKTGFNNWNITEVSTGALLLRGEQFDTRKEALAAITPWLLEKVSNALQTEAAKAFVDKLANYILERK